MGGCQGSTTNEHTPDDADTIARATNGTDDSINGPTESNIDIEEPEAIKHSPPVLVEDIDTRAGTITLTAFGHRFQRAGSQFRVDHCGWDSPVGSNLAEPDAPPSERPGYVAGRDPVWIDTDEVYMLDPMIDDFGAAKADQALVPDTVERNAL